MLKRIWTLSVVIGLVLTMVVPAWAQDDPQQAAAAAVDFLKTAQNEDGGLTNGFAPESDIATTADAVTALVAAGQDPVEFTSKDGVGPLDFLQNWVETNDMAEAGAGVVAKVVTALVAAGQDPAEFGDHNLVDDLLALQAEDGLFGFGAFDHCLAMIALQNAGVALPEGTVEAIVAAQGEDGGWGFMTEQASDTNTTGLCLQALALLDESEAVAKGLNYLQAIQNEDGGWPYQNPSEYGTDSDTNSTALVVQALVINGQDLAEWNNPQDWLLAMQLESGSFSFQQAFPGDNILATVAVIPAILGQPLNAWAVVPAAE